MTLSYDNIQYRFVSLAVDRPLSRALRLLERLAGFPKAQFPVFASPWYYYGYALKVGRDLRERRCDVAHVFNFSQFVPTIKSFNPGIRTVLHMHCEWLTQLDRSLIERRLEDVDLIIGCSDYITDRIRRRFPRFANRCRTVYNGVDVNHFAAWKRTMASHGIEVPRLLFVGRVSPEKGLHVLLEAFHRIVAEYPQVHLDIVGPESHVPFDFIVLVSDDEEVSKLARFYSRRLRRPAYLCHLQRRLPSSLSDRVSFVGPVPHARLVDYYRNAEVLINPSFSEAFGMSLVEAMATEVPVVATRVGGMPDVVEDDNTGLLVRVGDADAIAQATLLLLRDPSLKKSMGKAGRQRAIKTFAWERIVESLSREYEGLCERGSG
jgi:glycosyltransferase involved in cell wall biosynthesis